MKRKPPSRKAWAGIRLLALDVDGVLTDGSVFVSADGHEAKKFCITDGLGLILVRNAGVEIAWISGRKSKTTDLRSAELRIPHVIQGRHDKLTALTELAGILGIPLAACAYMGDDCIDAPAIAAAGIGISVPTGLPAAIVAASYVTKCLPGAGAVREVCDLILDAHGLTSGNKLRPKTVPLP